MIGPPRRETVRVSLAADTVARARERAAACGLSLERWCGDQVEVVLAERACQHAGQAQDQERDGLFLADRSAVELEPP